MSQASSPEHALPRSEPGRRRRRAAAFRRRSRRTRLGIPTSRSRCRRTAGPISQPAPGGGDQPAGAGSAAARTGGDGGGDRPQDREAEPEERPAGDEHPEPGCEPLHEVRAGSSAALASSSLPGPDPAGEQADRHGGGERHDRRRREQRARLGTGEAEPLLKRRAGRGAAPSRRRRSPARARDGEECAIRTDAGCGASWSSPSSGSGQPTDK